MSRWEIIIGGEGGQGVVLAGALLGEAAVRAGLNAAHTSSYGIATRGGFTRSDVVVVAPDRQIAYPRVRRPHLVAALSREAVSRLRPLCGPQALLVADPADLGPRGQGEARAGAPRPALEGGTPPCRELALPLREAAAREGGGRVLNMVALGALLGLTGMFPLSALEEVLRARFPGERAGVNCRAARRGFELARPRAGEE